MKLPSHIKSFIAGSLLLLFGLQAGLGLWWHTFFHQPVPAQQEQLVKNNRLVVSTSTASIVCSCVDDFLIPFTAVQHPILPQAPTLFFVQPQAGGYYYLPESLRIFRSLRAPPATIS